MDARQRKDSALCLSEQGRKLGCYGGHPKGHALSGQTGLRGSLPEQMRISGGIRGEYNQRPPAFYGQQRAIINHITMCRKYQPSNGSEGMSFISAFCDNCIHERWSHHQDENREEDKCGILSRTMLHNVDDPEYPTEWTYDKDGRPLCTAWKQWNWGNEIDGYNEPPPPPVPVDPNQLSLPFLAAGLKRFLENWKNPYLEDSVLWYCLDWGVESYLNMPLHDRINLKGSYFEGFGQRSAAMQRWGF